MIRLAFLLAACALAGPAQAATVADALERPALMVPNTTDPSVFLRIARYYNVRYLVLDSSQRPNAEVRAMLDELLDDPRVGFEEIYEATYSLAGRDPLTTEVYRFPQTYGGVAELRP